MTRRKSLLEIAEVRTRLMAHYETLPTNHPRRRELAVRISQLSIAEELARLDELKNIPPR